MGFWNKANETKLERELRARRPQPREEFVRMLSDQVTPQRRTRRLATPKVALIAAVTTALAASLGATGALGAAGGSVHSFSRSVVHIVSPPKADTTPARNGGATNSNASNNSNTNSADSNTASGDTDYSNATPTNPFRQQYGHLIPICFQGHIIYVTPRELIYYFFRGARPARFCGGPPIHR